jgi:oxygen-independent coproporphyrinogen-3 oxidase
VGDDDRIGDFPDLLITETDLVKSSFSTFSYDSIYFGGGTPSLLEPDRIESIIAALRSSFEFSRHTEITLECNPSSLTVGKIRGYRDAGVNRLSIGIQSFSDRILETLGRLHDSATAKSSFIDARRAGFDNINVDLIYGAPGQTLEIWERDIRSAIELEPEHISAYNLIIEPETEFGKLYRRGNLSLPGEDDQRDMYYLLVDTMLGGGLDRYEISNFARDGKVCRHNLKYWTNMPYLGLGPSAVSFDGERRVKNIARHEEYRDAVTGGRSAADSAEIIDTEMVIEERIMMGLRLSDGLSLTDLSRECHYDLVTDKAREIELLQNSGYIEITEDRLRITRSGLFVADEITIKLL